MAAFCHCYCYRNRTRSLSDFFYLIKMSNNFSGEVEVNRVFIGAGCNRIVNNISWGACGLVSFGSQNAVVIFCPKVLPTPFCFCFSFSICMNIKLTLFVNKIFDRLLRFWLRFQVIKLLWTAPTGFLVISLPLKVHPFCAFQIQVCALILVEN